MPRTPMRVLRPLGASLLCALLTTPVHAQFRSPQVPVTGSALQTFMAAQGQTIDVTTEQRLVEYFAGLYVTRPATHFFVRSFGDGIDALAVHDATLPATLYTIHPAGLLPGWFTEVRFDHTPRMIVNVYDDVGSLQGSTSYPGLGFNGFGLATSGPGGVFHAFDALNPGQRAHVLAFKGTGPRLGGTWLCLENQAEANGGDFDFADAIFLLENLSVTPVQRTTWGAIKQRFR